MTAIVVLVTLLLTPAASGSAAAPAPCETFVRSSATLPPLVRDCKSRQLAGDRIEVELYRPDSAGGLSRSDLVIHRWEQEKEQEPRQVEWRIDRSDGPDRDLIPGRIGPIAFGIVV